MAKTVHILVALVFGLVVVGIFELAWHRRNLRRLAIRIHVNGTRGKSSVTRLIAAGLNAGGVPACAKTTGTSARLVLPDGRELPVYRATPPSILEQLRVVAAAVASSARALVIECMALQPELQWFSEAKLVQSTHGVITNARPDHLDVMGPEVRDVALALAATTPRGGRLYTAERAHLEILATAARDRDTTIIAVDEAAVAAVGAADLAGFSYLEHAENVALALRVCADLGIDRSVALHGMWRAAPDPGALTEHLVEFFGRHVVFVNAFAGNDPTSTRRLWEEARVKHPEARRHIAIVNCRADRPARSAQFGAALVSWPAADHVILIGTGTYLFARAATKAGLDASRLVFAEDQSVEEIFETTVSLAGQSALVMGMGNIAGPGLALSQCFRNRCRLPEGRS
ncbi:MAG: poly-gamma-glutamate synthase PgsB [Deltaproteobacteria bacterium]|nr:poly-gamma-glutamate synthase PgsB [Deltaproteobacteria bacterium]